MANKQQPLTSLSRGAMMRQKPVFEASAKSVHVSKRCLSLRKVVISRASIDSQQTVERKKVIVVGGGWAGFGAAKHLAEQGYEVKLLDAAPNAGGLSTGWRTAEGRPVEAGTKGFWYQYPNIFALLKELQQAGFMSEWPLTDFLTSGFWSPEGLITEAPVFSKQPRLPTILGQFAYTAPLFYRLSLADRATIIPWLYNVINLNASPSTYERYDNMSAAEMFRNSGVTQAAYDLFLKPTLLVGLFASPEDLSAAVTLECLYFYALAHQNDFDVCWCKGTISERIFKPLISKIESAGGKICGSRLVTGLKVDEAGELRGVVAKNTVDSSEEVHEADAIVFAISVSGMQKLVSNIPELGAREEFRRIMNLRSIDCIATRLWFDRTIPTRFPANVLAGFEGDVGATYFNITDLQPDECKNDPGTVIAADFYGASDLLPLSDAEIVHKVQSNIATCEPAFRAAKVIDSAVLRFPRAVTHFSPGSLRSRPYQLTSFTRGKLRRDDDEGACVVLAGDWVRGLQHGANGLSQERAYVTGINAANLVIEQLGQGSKASILPIEPDEPHIIAAKTINKQLTGLINDLGLRPPFL
jgi:uncharacterized protein with NAD-binding domain and iron-sulfur cluster